MRKSIITILSCLLSACIIYGQANWQDSINRFDTEYSKLKYLTKSINALVYSDPEESFLLASIHDSISQSTNDPAHIAMTQNLYGMTHYVSGAFGESIDYYLVALAYFENSGDKATHARILNNIATCYQNRSDNDKSTSYFLEALKIYEELKDSVWIGNIHSNLSLQYLYDDKLMEAEYHIDRAVPILENINQEIYLGIALLNRGNLFIEQEKFNGALVDYERCMKLVPLAVSPLVHAAATTGIGSAYRRLGNYGQAIDYLQNGLAKAESIQHMDQMKDSNRELADLYEAMNRPQDALRYFKQYTAYKDSAFTIEQDGKLADALVKYETQEKDKEIALQEITILESQRQRNFLLGGIVGLFLMGGFIFVTVRRKHAYKAQIARHENLIQQEKIKRLKQEQKLIALDYMLMGEENERKRIAKDLHDSLGAQLFSVKLQLKKLNQELASSNHTNQFKKTEVMIDKAAQDVRRISHDMMPDALVNLGLVAAVEDLANNLNEGGQLQANTYAFEVDESLLTDPQKMGLYRIIQELIQNVIKHAQASHMVIQLTQDDHELKLDVEDDGLGFETTQIDSVEGIGLKNIRSRVQYLNGQLQISSKEGGPTIFTIAIPI